MDISLMEVIRTISTTGTSYPVADVATSISIILMIVTVIVLSIIIIVIVITYRGLSRLQESRLFCTVPRQPHLISEQYYEAGIIIPTL